MRGVCEFLDLPFDPAVLQPYDNKRERMISGIGDPNIMKHDQVDAKLSETWRKVKLPWRLGEPAQRLAAELQYELPAEAELASAPTPADRLAEGKDAEKIASLMASVAHLSDAEVKLMLEKLGSKP